MSEPFVGEIRLFGFNFAPRGWAQCNGQLMPISQNTALFSILGTQYGGDGKATFALPNLQGAVPLGADSQTYVPGSTGGSETVTLQAAQIPLHPHGVNCSANPGNAYGPPGNVWAPDAGGNQEYAAAASSSDQMNANAIGVTGGGQPHNNLQPFSVLNYCIALNGIFPPRG
jgi:microcystin-dependent protein